METKPEVVVDAEFWSRLDAHMKKEDQREESDTVSRIDLNDLQAAVSAGVLTGVKALATDSDFIERFWKTGYSHLTTHVGNGTSQWIGKRILTMIILSGVTAGIVWLVKSGAIK